MNVYEQLAARVLPIMTGYQTDVTEHDKREISDNPDNPFIHVTRDMSSHMFMKPKADWLAANKPQPYLFGHSTPLAICEGDEGLLRDYFNDSDTFHISDGLSVVSCSRQFALDSFVNWLRE